MRRFFLFGAFTTAMLLLPAFAKHLTDGFRVIKMRVDFPNYPEWEFPFDPDLRSLLDQPFYYINKGSQCYVFESLDKQYVIKFFRYNDPESELKVFTLFNAARIAYEQLRSETGLIFIHLNRTKMDLPTIHCKDALGRSYRFKLDNYRFAIQKRAMPFQPTMQTALKDPLLIQKRLDQFVDLLFARTAKGVFNADPSLSRNFGFLEDRAIEIDFGCFRPAAVHSKEFEIERYAGKLRQWLKTEAPDWVDYLDTQISLKKNQFT